MKNKVLFIVGPTATGKTDLAFNLASEFNGELISADSVQVFKNLDIISGKDLPPNYKFKNGYYFSYGSPSIHLLDVVEPTQTFNVSSFFTLASKIIESFLAKKKLPIIVGGTGLYIEALLNGLNETVEPDKKLREKLSNLSVIDLQKLIPKSDFSGLTESDKKNSRRLIRLIEKLKNQPKAKSLEPKPDYKSLVVGLECNKETLRKRIDERVEKRLKQGALDEAGILFKNYNNLSQQVKDANGYKQLFMFLKGEIDMDEAIYRWKISEYHHAKNQMTWFRKYGNVTWFDIEDKDFASKIREKIHKFLL